MRRLFVVLLLGIFIASTTFSATVTRKSNSHFDGTLVIDYNGSKGKILLSLVEPSS